MRPRVVLFGLAALIIALLVALGVADQFLVDMLWFISLGYWPVFLTIVSAKLLIFGAVWLAAFGAIALNGLIAVGLSREHERLHVVRRPDEVVEINLPELIRSLGERVPWKLLVVAAALILGALGAISESSAWDVYLKGLYGVSFGRVDPAFGRDIGFYIFTLPLLEELRDLALLLVFLSALVTGAVYWARGAIDFREAPPQISPAAVGHLSVLAAIFFIERAYSYWLDRFGLLLHSNGVVVGLRYVDQVLWRPGLWLLIALGLLAGMLCLANLRERGARLPIIAALVVFAPAILLNFAQPVVERLWVKPDELRIERPYLERDIALTRRAYNLDVIDVKPFAGAGKLTLASLQEDAPTIKNIRLWDPRPLIATYRQLQEIRLYYDFRDVDIDRYRIEGSYSQVMLSARELNTALLPENAQTWVNQHLKFTHGSGLAMSPVNARDSEGLPILDVKDIPPVSTVGLKIDRPGIYFGEMPDNYAIVKGAAPEFDYPRGADNAYSFYQGEAGIPVSGLLRRLLFAYFYRDVNLLVTDNIVEGSRILIRRNIVDRIARLVPFLSQDHDPYLVVSGGRLFWLVDCYTTSDHYPYSQPNPDGINYIRNSVKVLIDAYTGATTFYIADPHDPIIRCWQRILPAAFEPLSAMPPDLRAHIRYPEDFFMVQADIYRTYHMTDPQVFYNREDLWGFPRENYGGETVAMQPYYVLMRLPDHKNEEYILMLPMVPQGRDNMISWLAAGCDGANYGHLLEYSFSKDSLFYGPYQIQARINQNPDISRQLSLWNQMGSKVILGNLLVIPVQDSLLYVEPLYLRAENGQLPELNRVITSYGDRVVMAENLDQALAALFAPKAGPQPLVAKGPPPAPAPPVAAAAGAPRSDIRTASNLYNHALAALRSGDWAEFGSQMQKLGRALGQAPADERR